MGCVFRYKHKQKDGTVKEGSTWWIKYSRHGKAFFESSGSEKKTYAQGLLRLREGEKEAGKLPAQRVEKVLYDELREDIVTDYKMSGRKSLSRLQFSLKHLDAQFTGVKAVHINTEQVKAYIEKRQGEKNKAGMVKSSAGTINRELAALRRMFMIGSRQTPPKVLQVPYIPMLKESEPRQGYFEREEYLILRDALPDYLRPVFAMAYHTGMRRGEIFGLTWDRVDMISGRINLAVGSTKNGEGRTVFLTGELYETIQQQHFASLDEEGKHKSPFVFTGKDGDPIKDIRTAWETACKAAGLEGRLFHDLRRTGVRNMIRAGVPEVVAMKISGHKTRAVFDRYNIVDERDLRAAADKVTHLHRATDERLEKVNG